jgi:hypothetical protein
MSDSKDFLCETCGDPIDDGVEFDSATYCEECWKDLQQINIEARDAAVFGEEDEEVDRPAHYNSHVSGVECIDLNENFGHCLGNTFKYLFRREHKSSQRTNLKKAQWYLRREIVKYRPTSAKADQKEVRDIARLYQHEETGYSEAMLLLWAVSRPKQALSLVQEILNGLKQRREDPKTPETDETPPNDSE